MIVFFQMLSLLIPSVLGWLVGRKCGIVSTLLTGLVISTGCSLLGVWLLNQVAEGELSWKNWLAGWLLPWGYRAFPSNLNGIGFVSAVVFFCLFAFGLFLSQGLGTRLRSEPSNWTGPVGTWLLFGSWVANGLVLLFLLNQFTNYRDLSDGPGIPLVITMTIVALVIAISCGCRHLGYPGWALLVSGGPLLTAIVLYGLFVAVILFSGTTTRWN